MKQVVQSFKTGNLDVQDVPLPQLSSRMVLVENQASLISVGTERGTVNVAKASLLEKAKQRPDLVAQVIQNVKKEGLSATIDKVKSKLDAPKALGYSCAGIVMSSLDANNQFKPGDRVACAGQDFASHAEVVSIPQNLVVKIPDNVSYKEAAFTTVGAIALQGVRQAELEFGDNVCVIGLGLIGQITTQLVKASGANVFGIDLDQELIEVALKTGCDKALSRNHDALLSAVETFTANQGFDKVIITASTKSNDPVMLAGEIARKKGKVVLVGAVGMDVPRDPHYYRKELALVMSCSYGPGRYDMNYEEVGNDYPYAYVRWTEQRNMESFLGAVAKGAVDLKSLISHDFDIDQAPDAYELVSGTKKELCLGIVLSYPQREGKFDIPSDNKLTETQQDFGVSFIGAGSFAQSYILPNVKALNAPIRGILTSKGINASHVKSKFDIGQSYSDSKELLNDEKCGVVFITTRHDSHADYVIQALNAKKHVFVEKPLALTLDGLDEVSTAYQQSGKQLMVGFNRRFSDAAKIAKKHFSEVEGTKLINIRVNAGEIPEDSWIQSKEIGGGRIIGEVCHFIDLIQFFTEAKPIKVFAESLDGLGEKRTNSDNVSILIKMSDGSIGNILYAANGDKAMAKERIEIFGGSKSAIIDDFKVITTFSGNKSVKKKTSGKGHKQEIEVFMNAAENNQPFPISFKSMYLTTLTTFKILDSIGTGLPQEISLNV